MSVTRAGESVRALWAGLGFAALLGLGQGLQAEYKTAARVDLNKDGAPETIEYRVKEASTIPYARLRDHRYSDWSFRIKDGSTGDYVQYFGIRGASEIDVSILYGTGRPNKHFLYDSFPEILFSAEGDIKKILSYKNNEYTVYNVNREDNQSGMSLVLRR